MMEEDKAASRTVTGGRTSRYRNSAYRNVTWLSYSLKAAISKGGAVGHAASTNHGPSPVFHNSA